MDGCTSKQERRSMRSVNKETSTEKGRGRRPMRREMDEREKVMFEKLGAAWRVWRKERKKLREEEEIGGERRSKDNNNNRGESVLEIDC
ncbi:unnamed protein product [Brassica oleracea]